MQLTAATYLTVLPFVFLAGLVDSIAGGGGLISLPAYLAGGVPPHLALGNNKFSSTFGTLLSTARYFKHGMIDVPVAFCGAAFALAGSALGTRTVLWIQPYFLNYVLLALIPALTVFALTNRNLGRPQAAEPKPLSGRVALGALAGLVIGFYDGFFGPGTGTFLILFYAVLLKYDFVKANGNAKVVNLCSNIAALVVFWSYGKIQLALAAPAACFGIAGNLVGSKLVVCRGAHVIRPVFVLALVLLFSKIAYDVFWRSVH